MLYRTVHGSSCRLFSPLLALCLVASGACVPWSQDNPRDPARCDPRCASGQSCLNGACVAQDGSAGACNNNGVIDPNESCDTNELGGKTCVTQGWASGVLKCRSDCTFDTTGCTEGSCAHPRVATLVEGKLKATGTTSGMPTALASVKCGSDGPWPGPQLFHEVELTGKLAYRVTMTPNKWDGDLFAFPAATQCDAAAVAGGCKGHSSQTAAAGTAEEIAIAPAKTASWIIAAGSRSAAQHGPLTLRIESNDRCESAHLLTLSNKTVTVSGDTAAASVGSTNISTTGCTGSISPKSTTPGIDLFYAVALKPVKHTITLTPAADYDPALYVFTDCATPQVSCVAGLNSPGKGKKEVVTLTPSKLTTYLIAVDAYTANEAGAFTLRIVSD
jgi:hypothetical protein